MSSSADSFDSPKTAVLTLEDPEPKKIVDGLYVLMNKATRLVIDLAGGSPANGTKCNAHMHQYGGSWRNTVWLVRQDGVDGTYTLTHFGVGTALDLPGAKQDVHVHTWSRVHGHLNQQWAIREEAGFHTIQNPRSTQYLGVRSLDPGTPVMCSSFGAGDDQRLWEFERISKSAEEIINMVVKWDDSLSRRLSLPYSRDAQYFMLPHAIRTAVWEQTGIPRQPLRRHIFDYDDFAIKMKQAAADWVRDNFKTDGYSVLFGVIFGQGDRGAGAYNWYLSPDMQSLVFFDAKSGREFTPPALEEAGFRPSFGIF